MTAVAPWRAVLRHGRGAHHIRLPARRTSAGVWTVIGELLTRRRHVDFCRLGTGACRG
ncbi:hypothetical protein [Pseudonocardia sp. GCM10023141]|uniref:hypothetical protein n=1 Tax=Pseudonocardia sp. GCM10023141 TaxID=3252653 RepID=UPI0036233CCD